MAGPQAPPSALFDVIVSQLGVNSQIALVRRLLRQVKKALPDQAAFLRG